MARVLIVDDRALGRESLARLLRADGHDVREAEDGAVALERARAEPPELVVTDLVMPRMDGYALVRALRADPALAATPVVFFSSVYHEEDIRPLAERCGGCHFLARPSDADEILRVVRQTLGLPAAPGLGVAAEEFDREHLRLVSETLARKVEELSEALRDLRQRERELCELTQTLEERVAQRTAEADRRAAQLRTLTAELTRIEQRERQRVAQILHDHLQQLLTAARLRIAVVATRLGRVERSTDDLAQVEALVGEAVEVARTLSVELSPPVLQRGLVPALHWLSRDFLEKHQLAVAVTAEDEAEPSVEAQRVQLFHAAREFLFNVVKHAGVRRAALVLARLGPELRLEVRDRGAGFGDAQLGAERAGSGLLHLRHRLELLDGRLEIREGEDGGTCVAAVVPDPTPPVSPCPAA